MSLYKGASKINISNIGSRKSTLIYKGSQIVYRAWQGQTFRYTGNFQAFVVPTGLYKMRCEVVAARGQQGWSSGDTGWYYAPPGKGGKVDCVLSVTPGQILYIYVGYAGPDQTNFDCQTPKYNASDIRTNNAGILDASSLQSRLVVAGGGGGGVSGGTKRYGGSGGNGGGVTGANGTTPGLSSAGSGGSQSAGGQGGIGSGGNNGAPGGFGLGGNGSATAGGAGWYGGGGGALAGHNSIFYYSGGGGGSSYTHPTLCSSVVHTQGFNKGNGYVKISMAE